MWAAGQPSSPEREGFDSLLACTEEGDAIEEGEEAVPRSRISAREPLPKKSRRAGAVATALLTTAAALGGLALLAWPRGAPHGSRLVADTPASTGLAAAAAAACAGAGGDCRASSCCANGGKAGLQCYARDANWAQCDAACVPGEHEGEKPLVDQYGNSKQPAWSCNKLGARSKPGCVAHETPVDCGSAAGCEWGVPGGDDDKEQCLESCFTLDEGGCGAQGRCHWNGTTCQEACWTFAAKDMCLTTEHRKRCAWEEHAEKCKQGCWTHAKSDECWQGERCMWHGVCKDDPCSAPGEDCRNTQCCSGLRGAGGMTCFEKDAYYASCSKHCDEKDWSCNKLGNRTKTNPKCAWAGEDCASEGLCCNQGFVCAVKDKYFAGCMQSFKQMSFKKVNLKPPPGWPANPKIIGGGQFEYAMPPAPKGQGMGTTLYCFAAYLPGSYEERLIDIARANSASIFACDEHDLFHTWQSHMSTWDSKATTLTNIDVFIDVWNHVEKAGRLWKYDWTVKVDPDCLIVPERLRWHLGALNAPVKQPVYVKNNALNASIGNSGFLGAVEVFSREALELYFDWWPMCQKTIGVNGGEDGFMKGCMDAMGVGYVVDGGMFKPDNDPRVCKDGTKAAYHPLKIQENFQCCVDIVNGGKHFIEWGECKDLNAKWVWKVWKDCPADQSCREPKWNAR